MRFGDRHFGGGGCANLRPEVYEVTVPSLLVLWLLPMKILPHHHCEQKCSSLLAYIAYAV